MVSEHRTHSATRTPGNSRSQVPGLDGVRAIAVGAVFALHIARRYFPGGAYGVDVFFVLSAFLITGILLEERKEEGRVDYGAFYWRRAFRLGPALLLWLALIAVPTGLAEHAGSRVPWSVAGALLYFSDFLQAYTDHIANAFNQAWSLAVEEQFYFVWPVLLVLLAGWFQPRGLRRFMGAFVIFAVAITWFRGNYFLPTGHLMALALGAWAATLLAPNEHSPVLRIVDDSRVGALALVPMVAALFVSESAAFSSFALVFLVDIAATVLILHCTVARSSLVSSALGSPVPRWIGLRSYGIYLYGLTIMQLVPIATHLPLHFAAPLDLIITGLLVGVSFRFVESPIRARGRAWLAKRRETAAGQLPVLGQTTADA